MDALLTKDHKIIIFHDPGLTHVTNISDRFGKEKCDLVKESRFIDDKNEEVADIYTDSLTLDEIKLLGVK